MFLQKLVRTTYRNGQCHNPQRTTYRNGQCHNPQRTTYRNGQCHNPQRLEYQHSAYCCSSCDHTSFYSKTYPCEHYNSASCNKNVRHSGGTSTFSTRSLLGTRTGPSCCTNVNHWILDWWCKQTVWIEDSRFVECYVMSVYHSVFQSVAQSIYSALAVLVNNLFACMHFNTFVTCLLKRAKCSRYRSGVAQRVGRGIALLFHDRGTRRGWVVSGTPRPLFTHGILGTHFIGGWVDPRTGLDGRKISSPPGFDPGPSSP